jgi:hypothetical protein
MMDPSGVEYRTPKIFFDHYDNYRRNSGTLVQAWLVDWAVENKKASLAIEPNSIFDDKTTAELIHLKPGEYVIANYDFADGSHTTRSFCGGVARLYDVNEDKLEEGQNPIIMLTPGSFDMDSLEQEGVRQERHFISRKGRRGVKNGPLKATLP